jgi:hypothetical protein
VSERMRYVLYAGVLMGAVAVGVAVDVFGGEVDRAQSVPTEGARFAAKALFCPPSDAEAGSVRLAIAAADSAGISIGVEPAEQDAKELGDQMLFYRSDDAAPLEVVGYGGPVTAAGLGSASKPVEGAGATLCAEAASAHWDFASGSSSLDADERLLLYNPFPDEAVVRIEFATPTGERAPAALTDVAVPAGESVSVQVNEALQTVRSVGASIDAVRGRVVAWRQQFEKTSDEGPGGIEMTLGAPSPSENWYFAQGAVGEGTDERISVMNPGNKEAVVQIALTTQDETLTPAGLVELPVPGRSAQTFSLARALRKVTGARVGVSALVRSMNGVRVVAERSIEYSLGDIQGVAAEVGATAPKSKWISPPAAAQAIADSLAIFNPGATRASVSVTLAGVTGRTVRPKELAEIKVRGRSRVSIGLNAFTGGLPMVARVEATSPVVVERTAYAAAGDVATVRGVPVTPRP